MAFQRVDKKKPKLVPKEELEGFCYKSQLGHKEYVETGMSVVTVQDGLSAESSQFPVCVEDIPSLVKALWAAYAEAERRNLESDFQ